MFNKEFVISTAKRSSTQVVFESTKMNSVSSLVKLCFSPAELNYTNKASENQTWTSSLRRTARFIILNFGSVIPSLFCHLFHTIVSVIMINLFCRCKCHRCSKCNDILYMEQHSAADLAHGCSSYTNDISLHRRHRC